MPTRHLLYATVCALVAACGAKTTESNVEAPGADTAARTKVLEAGAAALQNKPPIEALNAYLDGFHFYNGNIKNQMEAHHYCSILNEDVTQCVIYDGNVKDAKIMGVEYIVSARLFQGLPEAEKAMWHSHVHEVKSGQLIAPGIPQLAEHELMKKLVSTYGKTWHTWHTDLQKELPIGVPQLMMGFTADGQHDPRMAAERDKRFGISSADKRADREDIETPPIDPGADAWQKGRVVQIADPTGVEHASAHGAESAVNPASNRSPQARRRGRQGSHQSSPVVAFSRGDPRACGACAGPEGRPALSAAVGRGAVLLRSACPAGLVPADPDPAATRRENDA